MKVHFKTYGCQMNERDSDAALALLVSRGHSSAATEADADAIVLNTCSVRDQAERKALGKLGLLLNLKRSKPSLVVGVMGCMAQRLGRELIDKMPELDFVVGADQIRCLPEIFEEIERSGHKVHEVAVARDPDSIEAMDSHRQPEAVGGLSAFVSISRGCNRFCSYCIVPYVRGRERSRSPEAVLAEVESLVAGGVKEIFLLGQNVAAYGLDGAAPPIDDAKSPFAELLERVSAVDGVKRIRFTSPHPAFFNARLIDAIASLPKVCDCVHLPLQSGSDSVLKRMNRPYSSAQYLAVARRLKEKIPSMLFSTDVIVGFPGETNEDFEATRRAMEAVCFDNAFIFKYSPRSGTKAAEMADDVPQAVKEERNQLLLADQEARARKINASMEGRTFEVMAEGVSKRNEARWAGRASNNKRVVFAPPAGVKPGDLLKIRIERSTPLTLYGELVET